MMGVKTNEEVEKKVIAMDLIGYNMHEIGRQLNIPASTVFNILHRSINDVKRREVTGNYIDQCVERNQKVRSFWNSIEVGQEVRIVVGSDAVKEKRVKNHIGTVVYKDSRNITIMKSGGYKVGFIINDFISRTHKIFKIESVVV